MLPVLCVVGPPGAPVGELIEGLLGELAATGTKVAVVMESADAPLKDDAPAAVGRYASAGSNLVMVSGRGAVLSLRRAPQEPSLDELVWEMRDEYDVVLAEGFRHSSFLKVEVHRAADGDQLLCHKNELLAVAGDRPEGLDVPAFPLDNSKGLAELVRRRFLTLEPGEDAAVFIDGVRLPIAMFVRQMVASTILGMVRTLKGVENPESVVVAVKKRR